MATPDQIATLSAWWKAETIALAHGSVVTSWADSSGNGNTATQATSTNQPTYAVGVANGLPAVRFDGTSDYLNSAASSSLTATTMFAVVRPTWAGTNLTIRGAGDGAGGTGTGGLAWRLGTGAIPGLTKQGVSNVGSAVASLPTSDFSIISASYTDTTNFFFYRGGALDGSDNHTQTLTSGRASTIGYNLDGFGEYYNGDLSELIVYSSVLSAADRAAVHTYLGRRYGIKVSDDTNPLEVLLPHDTNQIP